MGSFVKEPFGGEKETFTKRKQGNEDLAACDIVATKNCRREIFSFARFAKKE